MKKTIKRLFCKHEHREQIKHIEYRDGKQYSAYGLRCKQCGKETWL